MKWGEEIEEGPFAKDVEKACQTIANIKKVAAKPDGGPVVVYEWEKWWEYGPDKKQQVILDPKDEASLTRYKNVADHLEALVKNSNRHGQIRDVLKRTFEEK